MADATLLKQQYVRQLAGHPFRLTSIGSELIGRPDFTYKDDLALREDDPSIPQGERRKLQVRVVNQAEGWYAKGNVERWDRAAKAYVPFPEFYNWDADGHGTFVVPRLNAKTKQIMRTKDGTVMVDAKFKFFAAVDIETLDEVTVALPRPKKDADGHEVRDTEGRLQFEDVPVTGRAFTVELTQGGESSQHEKVLAAIKTAIGAKQAEAASTKANAARLRAKGPTMAAAADELDAEAAAQEAAADPLGVVLTMEYRPDAPEKDAIYSFTAVNDSAPGLTTAPVKASPSWGDEIALPSETAAASAEPSGQDIDLNEVPF